MSGPETEDHSWSSVLFFNHPTVANGDTPLLMPNDHEFIKRADSFMLEVLASLDDLDNDDLDAELAMGVLSVEFADGRKCIMNRQTAAHQIWLAHGATAWHFDFDTASGQWLDTKGRGELKSVLASTLGEKLGQSIAL